MNVLKLGESRLEPREFVAAARTARPSFEVTDRVRKKVREHRAVIEKILSEKQTRYGINTGFGYLANVRIDEGKLNDLQVNLVRSHACGVGDPVADEIVRGLLILRAHTFLLGHAGVTERCLDTILAFLEHDILPVIPEKGSVGASGDLAPLSHLALGLIGEGEVRYQGERQSAAQACKTAGVAPHSLSPKEGLSLINGTQFMATLGAFAVDEARILLEAADVIAAMSLDAIKGTVRTFDERIHSVRPQTGQLKVAANMRALFAKDDAILESHRHCGKVQDPYSFRCIPQVHGASRDAWVYAAEKVAVDLNSVTDNPLCFSDGDVLSGGNFHGQPIAMALDFLTIAMAEIGSISERRIEKLTNPTMSGLPAFLMKDMGLNSGFMIPHVVAAALVSENKVLSHPAVVDSIPTSADQEDHVSMGPISARKCREVISNVAHVLAIELLTACQGVEFHKPLQPGPLLLEVLAAVRSMSPAMPTDRSLHGDIEQVQRWILGGGIQKIATRHGLELS